MRFELRTSVPYGFGDIRECVTLWRLILRSLGVSHTWGFCSHIRPYSWYHFSTELGCWGNEGIKCLQVRAKPQWNLQNSNILYFWEAYKLLRMTLWRCGPKMASRVSVTNLGRMKISRIKLNPMHDIGTEACVRSICFLSSSSQLQVIFVNICDT